MTKMTRHMFVLMGLWLVLAGEAVLACPSCFAEAGEEQREAYIGTTIFLSALPLLLLGFLALRLYRGSRRTAARAGATAAEGMYG